MRVLELLNARLCHELISPVGAINNGVELMAEEEADAHFQRDAMKLIANSARTAGRRLNFYRFAYGSGRGSTGKDAALLLGRRQGQADWTDAASALPVEWRRLACNMVVLAAEALPRGGSLQVTAGRGREEASWLTPAAIASTLPPSYGRLWRWRDTSTP